jgi:hypothetical protein
VEATSDALLFAADTDGSRISYNGRDFEFVGHEENAARNLEDLQAEISE